METIGTATNHANQGVGSNAGIDAPDLQISVFALLFPLWRHHIAE
jgi:hypothetical protein